MNTSRRSFFKAAAAVAGIGIMPKFANASVPQKWDAEYDVVVIGFGGAGANAAVSAHDNGSKVLILEKHPEPGGNTSVSSGNFLWCKDPQKVRAYFTRLFDLSHCELDQDLLHTYTDKMQETVDWLKKLEPEANIRVVNRSSFPHIPDPNAIPFRRSREPPEAAGAGIWHTSGLSCPLGTKVPGHTASQAFNTKQTGYILVDQNGKRFINEKQIEHHAGILAVNYFDSYEMKYPRIPCYAIFDANSKEDGAFARVMVPAGCAIEKNGIGLEATIKKLKPASLKWVRTYRNLLRRLVSMPRICRLRSASGTVT